MFEKLSSVRQRQRCESWPTRAVWLFHLHRGGLGIGGEYDGVPHSRSLRLPGAPTPFDSESLCEIRVSEGERKFYDS
ncbi:hypothetical protein H671_1g3438 [Cricetulus griseus]|uniref:Uncharacterized protein n=1 Tax=Cricetulus griseus TaxID=10029 RepID=A0A061IKD6_CRIGR|nr:hypothetical protein H671_1g3438 [Cricetulus griseus]